MPNVNNRIEPSVYALISGDEIGYVGSTSKNAPNRLYEHIYRARVGHTAPVYEWMRSVGSDSIRAEVIAYEPDPLKRAQLEATIIADLIAQGHPLRNQKSRDGRVDSMSTESRRRIGDRAKGRDTWTKGKSGLAAGWTPERRAAQSARMKAH